MGEIIYPDVWGRVDVGDDAASLDYTSFESPVHLYMVSPYCDRRVALEQQAWLTDWVLQIN